MKIIMLTGAGILMLASLALGQEPMPMRGPGAQRLEQYKKLRMMEVLKLDETTSLKFFARYNRFQEDLRSLNEKKNGYIDELQSLRRQDASDAEYQRVLEKLRALGKPAIEIRENFLDEISSILTPKQVAEYVVFERNFVQNVREIMREMQQNRMRMNRPR